MFIDSTLTIKIDKIIIVTHLYSMRIASNDSDWLICHFDIVHQLYSAIVYNFVCIGENMCSDLATQELFCVIIFKNANLFALF